MHGGYLSLISGSITKMALVQSTHRISHQLETVVPIDRYPDKAKVEWHSLRTHCESGMFCSESAVVAKPFLIFWAVGKLKGWPKFGHKRNSVSGPL